jgi:hypothetical protein
MATGGPAKRLGILGLAMALTSPALVHLACAPRVPDGTLPAQLSDEAFWRLSAELSEPPGVFTHSDNLVSNEPFLVHNVRQLRPRGGVYIGVGPEQNFSYIARIEPAMAFVVDIRQENRDLHLMYKALFESSADRAEFVSRLFSRERPAGLGSRASANELFEALAGAKPSETLRDATARDVRHRLLDVHGWPLAPDDLAAIDYALNAFYQDGPDIQYGRSRPESEPSPSYRTLMTARDVRGLQRSYLATEDAFAAVKDLHARNLIVPVVGDFGGPNALTRVGDYIRRQGSHVAAFYASNVEVYLSNRQVVSFCTSLERLPWDSRTWFIGSRGLQPLEAKLKTCPRVAHSLEWRGPS